MDRRPLGHTGIEVSPIILGCGNFGGIGSDPDFFGRGESEEDAFRLLDRAVELGVTTLDTADAYGGGRSEATIGKWLRARGPELRARIVLSTKVFNPMGRDDDGGLSRSRILRQIDGSLERLGVEQVDLYLTHEPDPDTPLEETLAALDELVRAGKVRAVGASNIEPWRLEEALATSETGGLTRYGWVQNSFSLLDSGDEAELLPLCARHGLGYTPFSPLAGGWLTGKYTAENPYPAGSRMTLRPEPYAHLVDAHTFRALERFAGEAQRRGVEMATLAFAWLLAHPAVTAVVVGPRRPEHLEPAGRALALGLSPTERDELAGLFAPGTDDVAQAPARSSGAARGAGPEGTV